MRRWLLILMVVSCGWFGSAAAQAGPPQTRFSARETCEFKLLPDNVVVLTSTLTLTNARRGRPVSVRFTAGWSVGRLYPKATTALVIAVGPGKTARRSVTRRLANARELWSRLHEAEKVACASTRIYTIR